MLVGLARVRTVARLGAAAACGLLLVGTLATCGGTKTVTKTVTVAGTVPNGGATSASNSLASGAHIFVQFACTSATASAGGAASPRTSPLSARLASSSPSRN